MLDSCSGWHERLADLKAGSVYASFSSPRTNVVGFNTASAFKVNHKGGAIASAGYKNNLFPVITAKSNKE